MCQFHVKNTFFSESCGLLNLLKKKRPGRVPENPEIKASNDSDHNKSGEYSFSKKLVKSYFCFFGGPF